MDAKNRLINTDTLAVFTHTKRQCIAKACVPCMQKVSL